MKTVAVISQKGGSGKTTLALHLASAASAAGHKAMVLDLDPMATASPAFHWSKIRDEKEPRVICGHAEGVTSLQGLRASLHLRRDTNFVVIDSGPNDQDALLDSRGLHLVLIPCRPGVLDISPPS
jgi:chromosome partitioning protein